MYPIDLHVAQIHLSKVHFISEKLLKGNSFLVTNVNRAKIKHFIDIYMRLYKMI